MLADRLGYFKAADLAVTIEETPSGAKAIQALLGGSADVASAFHELAVQMDAQGRDLTSFVSLARYPRDMRWCRRQSLRRLSRGLRI